MNYIGQPIGVAENGRDRRFVSKYIRFWIVLVNCERARNKSYATASHIFHINRSHEVYGT